MTMLELYGQSFNSRMLLGTARYPSPSKLAKAVQASKTEIVTVSLRREAGSSYAGEKFWDLIKSLNITILPNTAGCYSAREAVTTAQMAREIFQTDWIKLEVIGDSESLHPDTAGLVEAARILSADGFKVFPYTTEDLVVAGKLMDTGCEVLMPWGAPIGTARGLNNEYGLRTLRSRFETIPIIIDAGIGLPSHAARAMELGSDAVLLNTAVARAENPVTMAEAFAEGIRAGRKAYLSGPMQPSDMPQTSTSLIDKADLRE